METTAPLQQVFNRCRESVPALRKESLDLRKKRLKALRRWVKDNKDRIHAAVYADLRKHAAEVDATEIFPVLSEIRLALDSLEEWAAPRKVDAPIYMAGTRAWVYHEPRGVCLVISPWNYPFNLAAGPLVSALAAGNSVVVKPSEMTPHTSRLVAEMCQEVFDPAIVAVCEGGVEVSQELLKLPFDHIFFTGSPAVGKLVMTAAAEHLSSVTLELGGKSPAIVDQSADVQEAARRIAVAKFINCGQTCIAPDYVLVDQRIADELVEAIIMEANRMFGHKEGVAASPSYARIINRRHFDRMNELVDDAIAGGASVAWEGSHDPDNLFFHPIVLTNVTPESRIMQEEIFGPALPILRYQATEEAIAFVEARPKPLALYLFARNARLRKQLLRETSAGTVCINDCAIQFLHNKLPFGGVNHSGFGKSHGYYGFLSFSNEKPVLKQKAGYTTVQAFYPPYTKTTQRLMDWFLRMF